MKSRQQNELKKDYRTMMIKNKSTETLNRHKDIFVENMLTKISLEEDEKMS